MLCKHISQVADDPALPTLPSPPGEESAVTSTEVAPHVEPIWNTIQSIAKARSRAKSDSADDVVKVNQLGRVKSDFVLLYKHLSQVVDEPSLMTLTSPPNGDTTVTSKGVNPAPHMEPIWDTIQSIAKARSRAKAEAAEEPTKVNPISREAPHPPLTYQPMCISKEINHG